MCSQLTGYQTEHTFRRIQVRRGFNWRHNALNTHPTEHNRLNHSESVGHCRATQCAHTKLGNGVAITWTRNPFARTRERGGNYTQRPRASTMASYTRCVVAGLRQRVCSTLAKRTFLSAHVRRKGHNGRRAQGGPTRRARQAGRPPAATPRKRPEPRRRAHALSERCWRAPSGRPPATQRARVWPRRATHAAPPGRA